MILHRLASPLALLGAAGALALGAPLAAPLAAQTAIKTPPLTEYGDLPSVERVALSYSGDRIAMITTIDGTRSLLVFEPGKPALLRIGVGERKVRDIRWIGDERVLLIASQTEKLGAFMGGDLVEFSVGQIVPIDSSAKPELVFGNRKDLLNSIMGDFGIRQIDGRWYGFFGALKLSNDGRGNYKPTDPRRHLIRVDLEKNTTLEIGQPAPYGYSSDWVIDEKGNVAAMLEVNPSEGSWRLRNGAGKVITSGTNKLGGLGLSGLGFDGTSVLLTERTEDDITWTEVSLTTGERKPFLEDIQVEDVYFDRLSGRIIGYLEGGTEPRPVFRDPAHTRAAASVRAAFPQDDMQMRGWTPDMTKLIVRTAGNQDSGTWYAVDMTKGAASAIAYERLGIEPDQVGTIAVFEYTASDGTKLDGILTLPPGLTPETARGLPAVMLPHGGPHAHDTKTFDWWAQAYATRGYAVFQPNFRGSTNRDTAFMRAGYGEWGRKMQQDKTEGLKALVEAGIVDAKRVCIVGASYGGYAALAGVTLEQGVYRCAVAVAPVSDIGDVYNESVQSSGQSRAARFALINQLGSRDSWNAVSPLRAAARADAPIMLIHGKDDTVVAYAHSTRMAKALKDAGKPHELVTLDGEDHWLSRSETRRSMLEAALRFVEQHNPAG